MHLFLSPHTDDAAFSCGGQIASLTRSGERVVIFTIMAGDPPVDFRPTDFTRELHTRWGLGEAASAGRRNEDMAASKMLGAEVKFGPYADAIYRVDLHDGGTLYSTRDSTFNAVHPNDPVKDARRAAVIQAIFGLFHLTNTDVIHAPLGVGHHVDHLLVRDMGKAIGQWRPNNPLYFYEEYPYAAKGLAEIKGAVAALNADVTRTLRHVDSPAIDAKIAAVGCYKSQLSSFWDSPNTMARELRAFTNQVGGEGEWLLLQ
jgi:LmbE family N-acetylglucosaminyl deacetylase